MNEFTTLYGFDDLVGRMQQHALAIDEHNVFVSSLTGRKGIKAVKPSLTAFERHMIALVSGYNMNKYPQDVLHDMYNKYSEALQEYTHAYAPLLSIPTGTADPYNGEALLNTWHANAVHTSVVCDEFYTMQFWALLQTLENYDTAREPVSLTKESVDILCDLSEMFMRATVTPKHPIVLYLIVASAYMRNFEKILVPYLPDFRRNIDDLVSMDVAARRKAWKRMRTLDTAFIKDYVKVVQCSPELWKWDGTGLLGCMIEDRYAKTVAAIWAGACHRYGFEED